MTPPMMEVFESYTNPKKIAEVMSMCMDRGVLTPVDVHAVFQSIVSETCSEQAVRMICDRFLADYERLRQQYNGEAKNRQVWEVFLAETAHYIRRVSGGRVQWHTTPPISMGDGFESVT